MLEEKIIIKRRIIDVQLDVQHGFVLLGGMDRIIFGFQILAIAHF
jgi:hypothetical protein